MGKLKLRTKSSDLPSTTQLMSGGRGIKTGSLTTVGVLTHCIMLMPKYNRCVWWGEGVGGEYQLVLKVLIQLFENHNSEQ